MNRRGEPCSDRPISGRALRACCGTARSAGTRCRRHCSSLDAKKKKKKTLTKEFIQSDFPSLPLLLIGGDGRKATQFKKHAHSDPHSGVTCSTFVIASSLSLSKRGTFFQWDFLSAFLHRTPQIQPRSLICRLCKFVCEFYNCVRRVFHRRHAPDD